ncbi:MAG: undecaprenyl/decaprenyl-phosphate alpha-N-acetylglucosaminyl 1-phosphate transferase [Phycisphaeraceae bacterium]|nr:undecaprenyl/decaprenyl-phosphate alpha-N-acetylglucosaminyl 1-phosphate transferase [Phycisphaeraceae bacterium]
MLPACLVLVLVSLALAAPLSYAAIRLGHRLQTLDTAARPGQSKLPRRAIPNTGGLAIVLAVTLPMVGALVMVHAAPDLLTTTVPALALQIPGLRAETATAAWLLAGLLALHALGLVDDRRPLGPAIKLLAILGISAIVVISTGTRLLVLLDAHAGGPWLSWVLTVLWFGVVINATNFMDNMDGLAGCSAAVATACFLVAALINGQWFVAASLSLLLGSTLGFLAFNIAPARLFMGDGGSLAIGYLLAFLTTRTTYYNPELSGGWYAACMPLIVLAIPLYDFVSVTLLRVSQGKSPFVGDLQHFSHRLHRRGLSVRQTMIVVGALTGVTGVSGIALGSLEPWQAALVGVQTLLILGVIAVLEFGPPTERRNA